MKRPQYGFESGQVVTGDYILQLDSVHGGVVQVSTPVQQPLLRPRPTPVFLRPRPASGLLDREAEMRAAATALQSALPVDLHGQPGVGKTTLLRHLAHHPVAASFPDGVVYLSAQRQSVEDLLQSLFSAFYESDVPCKPTPDQFRQALRGKRALVVLDDVSLAHGEVRALLDTAPTCTFLLAAPERCLWGRGQAIGLRGLPSGDALTLVEQVLERALTPEERPAAQALCTALDGHPLHVLQAVAMVREGDGSLAEIAQRVQVPAPAEALMVQVLAPLPEPEKRILMALAALGDVPLQADHLSVLTELPDVAPVLEALQRRGLVQAHSPRYSLTGDLGQVLRQARDLTLWAERALDYFATWAEGA